MLSPQVTKRIVISFDVFRCFFFCACRSTNIHSEKSSFKMAFISNGINKIKPRNNVVKHNEPFNFEWKSTKIKWFKSMNITRGPNAVFNWRFIFIKCYENDALSFCVFVHHVHLFISSFIEINCSRGDCVLFISDEIVFFVYGISSIYMLRKWQKQQ